MSRFEFLRNVPVGQYMPVDSLLHRLDPRARLLGYAWLVLALTFTFQYRGLLLGIGFGLLGLWLGQIPLRFALRAMVSPLPLIFFLAVLQVFLNTSPTTSPVLVPLGRFSITQSDLLAGGLLLLRFTGLVLILSLLSFTLSTSEMSHGLNALLKPFDQLGLPAQDLGMMVQVTLRFLPLLAQTAERIAKAQVSRGADWEGKRGGLLQRVRQVLPLIVPLFLASLHRAENMALAMDARAYGCVRDRGSFYAYQFTAKDFLALLLMGMVGILILRF